LAPVAPLGPVGPRPLILYLCDILKQLLDIVDTKILENTKK
jgi:hypothetical protein